MQRGKPQGWQRDCRSSISPPGLVTDGSTFRSGNPGPGSSSKRNYLDVLRAGSLLLLLTHGADTKPATVWSAQTPTRLSIPGPSAWLTFFGRPTPQPAPNGVAIDRYFRRPIESGLAKFTICRGNGCLVP